MDKQKQIEEMIITAYPIYATMEDSLRKEAIECMNSYTVFEKLYNAGYRNISKAAADCLAGEDVGLKLIDHYIHENNELRAKNKELRKGTAEKFAERFKEKMKDKYQGIGLWWTEIVLMAIEICKEFTEGKVNE